MEPHVSVCFITLPNAPIAIPVIDLPSWRTLFMPATMVSMSSSVLSSRLLSCLHFRHCHQRRRRARVFDADSDSDMGPLPASHTFQIDLAKMLQKLTNISHVDDANNCSSSSKPSVVGHLMSLTWICQAFDVVIATQESVKQALCNYSMTPISHASGRDQKMVDHCMPDIVKMLDACCLLKKTLARAHAHVKASNQALKRLQGMRLMNQGDVQRAQHATRSWAHKGNEPSKAVAPQFFTKRLQACSSILRRTGEKLPTPPTAEDCEDLPTGATMATLYGGEICTLFFLRLLSTALSSPAGTSSLNSTANPLHLPGRPVWGPSLLALQDRLYTELSQIASQRPCGATLLPEMCTLDASLHQIYKSLLHVSSTKQGRMDVRGLLGSTSLLADHLQSSIVRLSHQLDRISTLLVDIQMALLESQ